jgi:sec-independent protein translocase protein TatA
MTPLFGWTIGLPELFIVGLVVLLLFGNRLPSVMRSLGRGVIEFKKGVQGVEEDLDEKTESKP